MPFLKHILNPAHKAFRSEVARIADACYRAGKFPHRRFFPDVDQRCLHTGNALLIAIDSLWIERENEINATHTSISTQTPENSDTSVEEESPVVIVDA